MGLYRNMGRIRRMLGRTAASAVLAFLTLHSVLTTAQVSDVPLAISTGAAGNIVFILDDSGSMGWEWMPNSVSTEWPNRFYYSSRVNRVWFNPNVQYQPPVSRDGNGRMPDADYNDAWRDGYAQTGSVDLSEQLPHRGFDFTDFTNFQEIPSPGNASDGAFYFEFNGGDPSCDEVEDETNNDCYSLVEVNEEAEAVQQNFANWFSYYRTRQFAARAGIAEAFEVLGDGIRVGWGAINANNTDAVVNNTLIQGVRPFNDTGSKDFRDWLYSRPASGGTPLRTSLDDIGEYYQNDTDDGPWSDNPLDGTSDNPHAACRQSFSVIMTDGFWNQGSPGVGDEDNTAGSQIVNDGEGDNFQYSPVEPFADNQNNTLADVAMNYWKRDLRSDLDNLVPNSNRNPAFWQHMVTYGVGLGVSGTVDPDAAFDAISDNDPINWASVGSDPGKIDDLLHAAVNGRGGFFSASSPDVFATELGGILEEIQARVESSSSAAAASSAVLNAETDRFIARFRSDDWSGEVVSENIEDGTGNWNAEDGLAGMNPSDRNFFTYDGSNGSVLDLLSLSSAQKDALDTDTDGNPDGEGSGRIDWLRGENPGGKFRNRSSPDGKRLLGDIVNSNPQIERKINFGHARLPQGGYRAYRASSEYQDRPEVLYVGANDGFLHAFDSENGEELFAYMPSSLLEPKGGNDYAQINELMEPDYEHRFFVDGTPSIMDAFIDGEWKTVLVGSMGAGGEHVFALDITNPESFEEDDVLWEFSHPDLERGADNPQVGRLPTGDWAAVFGNGVAGDDGTLFVVNLETGNLIETLDAGDGGLATPVLTNDEGSIEFAYAGNVDGELFRFDLSKSNTSDWDSTVLFETEGPGGDAQPITSKPRVANMPKSLTKRVVSFGTGSFFEQGDRSDSSVQSLYGIIDEAGSTSGVERDDLVEQTIINDEDRIFNVQQENGTTQQETFTIRKISENPILSGDQGWVLDLDTVSGERVVSEPTFPSGLGRERVRFSTLIPESNVCSSGTDGFLMEISLVSGGRTNEPVFDMTNDGEFGPDDVSGVRGVLAGEKLTTVREGDKDQVVTDEQSLRAGSLGVGRQAWEQFR